MAIYSENKFSPLQRLTKPATYDMFTDVIISTGCPPPPLPLLPVHSQTDCHFYSWMPPSTPVHSQTGLPPPPPQFSHKLTGRPLHPSSLTDWSAKCVLMWIASNSRVCSFDQVAAPLQRFQKKKVKKIVKLSTWVSWISYCLHRRWWLKYNKALFFI